MRPSRGAYWLAAASIVLIGTTIASFFAPPCDPYRRLSFAEIEDWFCRCDSDAAERLEHISFDVTAVSVLPDGNVLFGGRGLRLRRSNASGTNWSEPRIEHDPSSDDEGSGDWFLAIRINGLNGTAITREGRIFRTRDTGAQWTEDPPRYEAALAPLRPLRSATIGPAGLIVLVAADGAAYQLRAGGPEPYAPAADLLALIPATTTTQRVVLTVRRDIRVGGTALRLDLDPRAAFATDSAVWVVGGKPGELVRSRDGGVRWAPVPVPTNALLQAVSFDATGTGWVVGNDGVILRGTRFGDRWTHHAREPLPVRPVARSSMLPAGFFLANGATLFLVWMSWRSPSRRSGTGTLSVAQKIASDRPIQETDHDALGFRRIARSVAELLSYGDTEPPLTIAFDGPWGSGKTSLLKLVEGLLPASQFRVVRFNAWHHQREEHLLASLLKTIQTDTVPQWWRPFSSLAFRLRLAGRRAFRRPLRFLFLLLLVLGAVVAAIAFYPRLPREMREYVTLGRGLIGAVFIGLTTLWSMSQPFHAKARDVVRRAVDLGKLRTLEAHLSFRDRFAEEFGDVTKSLPQRLVIMIDDLDRCAADNVMEILETINFLTGSGECFFILALDVETVRRHLHSPTVSDPAYGAKYLEKLINIAIPLMQPSRDQALRIMLPESAPVKIRKMARLQWLLAAVVAAAYLTAVTSLTPLVHPERPAPAEARQNVGGARPSKGRDTKRVGAAPEKPRVSVGDTAATAYQRLTGRSYRWLWPTGVFALLLGGVAVRLALRVRPWFVDSPAFRDAIGIWVDLVSRNATPRSLKRFTNRVRYLAIRARIEREDGTLSPTLTDEALVALTAIEHGAPELFRDDILDPQQPNPSPMWPVLKDAVAAHATRFEPLSIATLRPHYETLVRPVPPDPTGSSPPSATWLRASSVSLMLVLLCGLAACRPSELGPEDVPQSEQVTAQELEGRGFWGWIETKGVKKGCHLKILKLNHEAPAVLFEYELLQDGLQVIEGTGTVYFDKGLIEFGTYSGTVTRDPRDWGIIVFRSSSTDETPWVFHAVKRSKPGVQ